MYPLLVADCQFAPTFAFHLCFFWASKKGSTMFIHICSSCREGLRDKNSHVCRLFVEGFPSLHSHSSARHIGETVAIYGCVTGEILDASQGFGCCGTGCVWAFFFQSPETSPCGLFLNGFKMATFMREYMLCLLFIMIQYTTAHIDCSSTETLSNPVHVTCDVCKFGVLL